LANALTNKNKWHRKIHNSTKLTGWPLSRHCKIPRQFPDNTRHSCPL